MGLMSLPARPDDRERAVERRRGIATNLRRQSHGGGRVSPELAVEIVREPVEQQVQPGTGADLANFERQAGLAGNRQEAGKQHGRARDLVGLRRAVERAAKGRVVARNRARQNAGQHGRIGGMRRIGGRQFVISAGRGPAHAGRRKGAATARHRACCLAMRARGGQSLSFRRAARPARGRGGGERRAKRVASLSLAAKVQPHAFAAVAFVRFAHDPARRCRSGGQRLLDLGQQLLLDRIDRERADMLEGDLAVLADDECLRDAVDAPVDRAAPVRIDADAEQTDCRTRPGISGRGPVGSL